MVYAKFKFELGEEKVTALIGFPKTTSDLGWGVEAVTYIRNKGEGKTQFNYLYIEPTEEEAATAIADLSLSGAENWANLLTRTNAIQTWLGKSTLVHDTVSGEKSGKAFGTYMLCKMKLDISVGKEVNPPAVSFEVLNPVVNKLAEGISILGSEEALKDIEVDYFEEHYYVEVEDLTVEFFTEAGANNFAEKLKALAVDKAIKLSREMNSKQFMEQMALATEYVYDDLLMLGKKLTVEGIKVGEVCGKWGISIQGEYVVTGINYESHANELKEKIVEDAVEILNGKRKRI